MRLKRVIWNPWQSNEKLRNMRNQSFEVLFHKQIRNARRGSKEKSAMKHIWWQSCQPLLENFLKSDLCMLYVVSKLRKSEIQYFKRYTIRSWNEGVTAVGSRTLQAESQLRSATKSAFCCEVISQPFLCVCEISQTLFSPANWSLVLPDICDRHIEIFFFRFLLSKSQNSPCKPPIVGFLSY